MLQIFLYPYHHHQEMPQKSTIRDRSSAQQREEARSAIQGLFDNVEQYNSPHIEDKHHNLLKIRSIPMTFDDKGRYDPPLDPYFFEPLPLEHLLQRPINPDPGTGVDMRRYPDFEPEKGKNGPYYSTRLLRRAEAINLYLLWEFTNAPRKGTEDDSGDLMTMSQWHPSG